MPVNVFVFLSAVTRVKAPFSRSSFGTFPAFLCSENKMLCRLHPLWCPVSQELGAAPLLRERSEVRTEDMVWI